jgi:hypothetical protein
MIPMNLPHPPPRPRLAAGVGRAGFRKWYERELLSGHAHMVLALFSLIGLLGSLEALSGAENVATHAVAALASAVIGWWAARRYVARMMRAEYVAHQATCRECGEYGRFEVIGDHGTQAQVRCRRCSHRWLISDD